MPTIVPSDIAAIGFLIFLEGVLSIDNALVLALLASTLPPELRKRALTYGIAGAILFRILAIGMASYLMHWWWVKILGGAYLLYLAGHYWWSKSQGTDGDEEKKAKQRSFWGTVVVIELTDIAFAVDSILTAVALSSKVWVVMTGGVLGLLMMRFAATLFIKLLERFPRFEPTAYILVFIIGVKLVIESFHFKQVDFHNVHNPAFWVFWATMLLAFLYGFSGRKKSA